MRRLGWIPVLVWLLSSCAQPPTGAPPSAQPSSPERTPATTVAPSITRDVPPEQRRRLADVPQLCDLVSPQELGELAFPVDPGRPRDTGFNPPVRGCTYQETNGSRSVLIGQQPTGYAALGRTEVELGAVPGTRTLNAGDCTVFAGVSGAVLQVSVTADEATSEQCDAAQGIAQYVLAGLVV
ncbi:DUF3558 family protein [Saccharopolyspora rosea]|uniref:DUF3558 family protein n=1 Tax=Saccharopolyspora rosea TaxID=524884 RepID=A0ABW3FKC8_9PSEU